MSQTVISIVLPHSMRSRSIVRFAFGIVSVVACNLYQLTVCELRIEANVVAIDGSMELEYPVILCI
jgi:hypothetical protein